MDEWAAAVDQHEFVMNHWDYIPESTRQRIAGMVVLYLATLPHDAREWRDGSQAEPLTIGRAGRKRRATSG